MLGSDRVYFALALVTAAAMGCGGGDTVGTGGSGGQTTTTTTTTTTTSSTTSETMSGSDAGPTCMGEGTVLAVSKLSFGEGPNGQWKKVGFDIDNLVTSGASTDVCKPNAGGKPGVAFPDGDNGIDNSFGKNLLPQIVALYPTWTDDINNSVQTGVSTVMLKLECLPPTGDVPVLTTKLFGGAMLGYQPKFDGTDKWPVRPELLSDPLNPDSSTIVFDKCSVMGSTFDSGNNAQFILSVPVNTQTNTTSIKLTLNAARLTMILSDDRKSATGGIIGGVLNTEEFVTEVKKVGALLSLCNNALFTSLLDQIRQSSDIMADGTQDPNKTCDGITMGLGFELKEVQRGDVGVALPPGATCQ